jgi:ferrous iron transport protein B
VSEAVIGSERPSFTRIRESDAAAAHTVVLMGNPNVGKTTLFNALTGENAKVGNYPGITVERRSARLELPGRVGSVELVDVPGAYSLSARSPEEKVALDAALGLYDNPRPSLAVMVVDAGQLQRNLYLVLQLVEFQVPVVIALTMMDEVSERPPKAEAVGAIFGVPCVAVSGKRRDGLDALREAIGAAIQVVRVGDARIGYSAGLRQDVDRVAADLPKEWRRNVEHDRAMAAWALLSLDDEDELEAPEELRALCREVRGDAAAAGRDVDLEMVSARYEFLERGLHGVYADAQLRAAKTDWTERWDRVLLHPLWGFLSFAVVMLVVFQSLFSWTDPAIGLIEDGIAALRDVVTMALPPGVFTDALNEGVLGGVGNVVVFLPQILLLFFFVGLLEDSGYMARIAYLMDRVLRGAGLHGRAFVPMLSGMACAVPAILATRTMERQRDRLLTMMVVPLMTCSARLPVYSLVIATLFPPTNAFGLLPVQGLLMVGMYVFSTVTTLLAAYVLGRTVVRGRSVPLLLELPRYRWPSLSATLRMMWQRTRAFLTEAGTVILAFTLLLWCLLSFPKPPDGAESSLPVAAQEIHAPSALHAAHPGAAEEAGEESSSEAARALQYSFGARLGKALEPVMAPLGFDWKLTVGIIGAFSAREVFVSTLGLVFGLEGADETPDPLRDKMRAETRPDGKPAYTPLVGLSLMVFFALACQCMSTLAVVKRETRSWRWPALLFVYMTVLAYGASFIVYQGGKLLGFAG